MKTKFLIQRQTGFLLHDFSLALIEAVGYQKFLGYNDYSIKYTKTIESKHKNCIPVGSLEFAIQYYKVFFPLLFLKPINVPTQLFAFCRRKIYNDSDPSFLTGTRLFIKSNDVFKEDIIYSGSEDIQLYGNYQISELIEIQSEWRCFVFKGKLVGLQNYSGDFTLFPNVCKIQKMILAYDQSPIAYTLDVGVNSKHTFVIECHDFFSCGLYGFNDYSVYLRMLITSHNEKIWSLK